MSHTWQTFDKCLKIGTFHLIYIYKLSTLLCVRHYVELSEAYKEKESMILFSKAHQLS